MLDIGRKLPNSSVLLVTESRIETIDLMDKLVGRSIAIFGMPGAFTETCTELHIPNILKYKQKLLDLGVEEIFVIVVNDAFVVRRWGYSFDAFNQGITLIADSSSEFSKAVGLVFSVPSIGFYDRSLRYAMLSRDGEVEKFLIEKSEDEITTSGADTLAEAISER
ncbi:MAG: peroxiredoxin [Porticoccaceae bacterium]|nr:peroxiredoxin [Porticoccaceae bacterium]